MKIHLDRILIHVYTVLVYHVQYAKNRRIAKLEIIISSSIDKPIYEQIVSQIKEMIMIGELKSGDTLPSMRKLAKSLHVSVITTQKAYETLMRDGFIETIPAKGTFVSNANKDFIIEENRRRIEAMLSDTVTLARENGISLDSLINTMKILYLEDEK